MSTSIAIMSTSQSHYRQTLAISSLPTPSFHPRCPVHCSRLRQAKIAAYVEKHGMKAMRIARSGGQYTHPDGIFFGGMGPTWSRRTMEMIARYFQLR